MSYGKSILFVYNSDSDVLPVIKDYSSRAGTVSGSDFCSLSAITQSPVGMKKDWKRFIRELNIPARFLNKNEFSSEISRHFTTFPAIFIQAGKDLSLMVSPDEINRCQSLEDLITLVRSRFTNIC